MQAALPRHLERCHASEESVAAALKLSGKERRAAFENLRKRGIYESNQKSVRSGNVTTIMRERDSSKPTIDAKICPSCKGFYSKGYMWRHRKTCKGTEVETSTPAIPVQLLSLTDIPVDSTFATALLAAFHQSPVGDLCRTDWVIQAIGQHQWAKNTKDDKTSSMTAMRRLAHLVLTCREVIKEGGTTNSEPFTGEDLFKRKKFPIVTKALKICTQGEHKIKASLTVGLSYLMRSSAETLRAVYLIREEDDKADEMTKYLDILKHEWAPLTNKAVADIKIRGEELLRRPIQLPLDEDIKSIKVYTFSTINALLEDPDKLWTTHDFNQLRTLLVCRLTLFNARRGGEPARLRLTSWFDAEKGSWVDPKAVERLSEGDRLLTGAYLITWIVGKGKQLVPILFPKDIVKGIRKLVSLRATVAINPINRYLFPATRNSTRPVMGNQCIAAICLAAGIQAPERVTAAKEGNKITATKMRHRASTVYAGLDVPEKDRKAFYVHMGHSAAINADIYQMPSSIQEMVIVGKHLSNMDDFDGKNWETSTANVLFCKSTLQQKYSKSSLITFILHNSSEMAP
jgi:hypothetical protein